LAKTNGILTKSIYQGVKTFVASTKQKSCYESRKNP
jgi:hypothetical protein